MEDVAYRLVDAIMQYTVSKVGKPVKGFHLFAVDDHWQLAVNGTEEAVSAAPPGSMAVDVPSYQFAVWYNGWLAGIVVPFYGCREFAAGTDATPEAFIAALRTCGPGADGVGSVWIARLPAGCQKPL